MIILHPPTLSYLSCHELVGRACDHPLRNKWLRITLMILVAFSLRADANTKHTVLGTWKSEPMILQISQKNQQLSASVKKVFSLKDGNVPDTCERGSCKGKKFTTLEIFKDFRWNEKKKRWEGKMLAAGWNGKWYTTHIWTTNSNHMISRSYIGFFFHSLHWTRI